MKNETEYIDELLAFLPSLRNTDKFIDGNISAKKNKEGVMVISMPTYIENVSNFFRLVENKLRTDYDYNANVTEANLYDDNFIKDASFEQINSLLFFCYRIERFCDGCWDQYLKDGRIVMILERLTELRKDLTIE